MKNDEKSRSDVEKAIGWESLLSASESSINYITHKLNVNFFHNHFHT